ncbi:hypothetical protein KAR10_10030 [bacterium]|nr:hypothetical protein [bacterium]
MKKKIQTIWAAGIFMTVLILSQSWQAGAAEPPRNLVASSGNASVGLIWEIPFEGANTLSAYHIYRDSLKIESTNTLTAWFLAKELENGVPYLFEVSAVYEDGNSATAQGLTVVPAVRLLAPEGLTATVEETNITINWEGVAQQTALLAGYNIYRAITPNAAEWDTFSLGLETSYLDSNVNFASVNTYYYRVTAIDSLGNTGSYSEILGVTSFAGSTVPAKPSDLSAHTLDSGIFLAWNESESVDEYQVFYTTIPGGSGTIQSTTYNYITITPLTNNTLYYFYIAAVCDGLFSQRAEISATPRSLPTMVAGLGSHAGNGYVQLTWTASPAQEGIISYRIHREIDSLGVTLTSISAGITAYYDEDVGNSQNYYYAVAAVNSTGQGEDAFTGLVTPAENTLPVLPRNFRTGMGISRTIDFSWDLNPGGDNLTSYILYLPTGDPWIIPADISTTRVAEGLTNGMIFDFYLQAENASGSSNSVVVHAAPLAVPSFFQAQVSNNNILLSWNEGDYPSGAEYLLSRTDAGFLNPVLLTNTGSALAYTDAGRLNGTYYYQLTACNVQGLEADAAYALTATAAVFEPPLPPQQVALISGDQEIKVIWRSVEQADTFNLYRTTTDGIYGTPISAGALKSTDTWFMDVHSAENPIINKQKYYYCLSALNDAGESTRSAQAWAVPYKPVQLPDDSAIEFLKLRRKVKLQWKPSIPGDYPIIGYNLYRSHDGGANFIVQGNTPTVAASSNTIAVFTYLDEDIAYNTTYIYRLHALDFDAVYDLYHEGPAYLLISVTIEQPVNRIQVLRNAFNPACGECVPIQLMQVQPGRVWIKIYNLAGEYIRTLFDKEIQGTYSALDPYISPLIYWDGRNNQGEIAASGVYLIHAEGPSRYHQTRKIAVIK